MERAGANAFVVREDRRAVNLPGFAISATRDSDVVVSDLSYTGCQLRAGDAFVIGETFELRVIKRGALAVEIRWVRDDCAGARFVN